MRDSDLYTLNLKELIDLHTRLSGILEEDYDFFNIMSMSKEWVKSVETSPGSSYITPFTDIYKDPFELYTQTKKAVGAQIQHLEENPKLVAYVGTTIDRDTGTLKGYTNNYILDKLQNNG